MSLLSDLKSTFAKVTAGNWAATAKATARQQPIGGFERDADAEFVVLTWRAAPHLLKLCDAAKAVNSRSILGITYLRKVERDAIAAALKALDA